MGTRGVRPLVDSALLAALGAVLVLLGWYVPVVGLFASIVSPLPTAVAVIRHGARWGVMSSLVTAFVTAPLIGIPLAVSLWAVNGAMGISFGVAVRRNMRPTMVLVTAAAGSIVAIIVGYAAMFLVMGVTPRGEIAKMVSIYRQALEKSQALLGPNPAAEEILRVFDVDFILSIAPAGVVLGGFGLAWMNYEVFSRVLPRLGHSLEPLPPFSRWIFPEFVAHAGFLTFILPYFQSFVAVPGFSALIQNLSFVTGPLFTIESLSVLSFYLMQSGMSRGMTVLAGFLVVSVLAQAGPLSLLAPLFGMIDILFDFRRLRYPPVGEI
ncbi:MAG: DUF2232 domain-containing protein [Bacillota bacterium]